MSKSSTKILQHTKCITASSITRWESLIVTSLQCQYLTRRIYNRASLEIVGTLQRFTHTMQYQQHYQPMKITMKINAFLNTTTWPVYLSSFQSYMYTYTLHTSIHTSMTLSITTPLGMFKVHLTGSQDTKTRISGFVLVPVTLKFTLVLPVL